MYLSNSSQVITPGVLSVVSVYPGQVHFSGYAPNSLHMSTQTSASLFWNIDRMARSCASHDCSLFKANAPLAKKTNKTTFIANNRLDDGSNEKLMQKSSTLE